MDVLTYNLEEDRWVQRSSCSTWEFHSWQARSGFGFNFVQKFLSCGVPGEIPKGRQRALHLGKFAITHPRFELFGRNSVEVTSCKQRIRVRFKEAGSYQEFLKNLEDWEVAHLDSFKPVDSFDMDGRIIEVGSQVGSTGAVMNSSDLRSFIPGLDPYSYGVHGDISESLLRISNTVTDKKKVKVVGTLSRGSSLRTSFTTSNTRRCFTREASGILVEAEMRVVLYDINDAKTPISYMDIASGLTQVCTLSQDRLDLRLKSLCNISKASQTEPHCNFWGLFENSLSSWDFRSSTSAPVSEYKYRSKPNFRDIAVTGDGCMVVGSEYGVVRLYTEKYMKQAITKFPSIHTSIPGWLSRLIKN